MGARSILLCAVAAALLACAGQRPFVCAARGGPQWRELRSEHFRLQTAVGSEQARAALGNLEALRARLLRSMDARPPADQPPLLVILMENRKQLAESSGAFGERSSGLFLYDGVGRQWILLDGSLDLHQRQTLAHELAHHLSHFAAARQPRWFSEGVATWLAAMAVGGLPPEWLLQMMKRPVPVQEIFDWPTAEKTQTNGRYATAFLLVNYLVDRRPEEFNAFQLRLSKGEPWAQAWNATFPEFPQPPPEAAATPLDLVLRQYAPEARVPFGPLLQVGRVAATERPLSPAEVHAMRLELPRRWATFAREAELDEALSEDPGHPAALSALAGEEPHLELLFARKAVAAHPDDGRAWLLLGAALGGAPGARAEREQALRRALALLDDPLEAQLELAELLLELERLPEALAVLDAAAKHAPGSLSALLLRARVLAADGQCKPALDSAERAVNVISEAVPAEARQRARTRLGDLQRKCGSRESLLSDVLANDARRALARGAQETSARLLREATALDPDDPRLWADLGQTLLLQSKRPEAIAALQRATALEPRSEGAWQWLGLALLQEGRRDEQEAAFRRQLEVTPDHRGALRSLATTLRRSGRSKEAMPLLRKLENLAPDNPLAPSDLGAAYLEQGQREQGLLVLGRATRGKDPWRRNLAAYALAEIGQELDLAEGWAREALEGATELVKRSRTSREALRHTGPLAATWDTVGWVAFRQGKLAEAERYIAAAERLSLSGESALHLGQIYEAQGRREEAVQAYARSRSALFAPFLARERLAALVDEGQVDAVVAQARAGLADRYSLPAGPATGEGQQPDVVLLLGADGVVASVEPAFGLDLPRGAEALRGQAIGAPLPLPAGMTLPVRVRFLCAAGTCVARRSLLPGEDG